MLRCIIDAEMNAVLNTSVPPAPIRRERIGAWRERLWLPNGREVLMRPIESRDAEALRRSFARLSPEEVRLRFLHPITEMTPAFAKQLCELDRATGFALVVTEPRPTGDALIGAVARLAVDPQRRDAEFAIIVGREIGGQGLGIFLMKRLIDYARRRRLDVVWGDVREENSVMLAVCDELGFKRSQHPDELGIVRVSKRLRSA
jgi:RimJ/RimL family protein N-acetyltransferase